MQLWFNATFEPSLNTIVSPNLEGGAEGLRLSQLTPDDEKYASKEAFETYFYLFTTTENTYHNTWKRDTTTLDQLL